MKKVNKKALTGMLVAMVMSLGVMNGISNKKETQDTTLQLCAAAAYYEPADHELSFGETVAIAGYTGFLSSGVGLAFFMMNPLAGAVASIAVGM